MVSTNGYHATSRCIAPPNDSLNRPFAKVSRLGGSEQGALVQPFAQRLEQPQIMMTLKLLVTRALLLVAISYY